MSLYNEQFVQHCLATYTKERLKRKLSIGEYNIDLREFNISSLTWRASISEAIRRLIFEWSPPRT